VFALDRIACAPGLDPYVEHHWTVAWDLPAARTQPSDVLSHPSVHLTVEEGDGPRHGVALPAVLVHGVPTRRFEVQLSGSGRVTGVKFRPGGFTALTGLPAHTFTDRAVPATEVWPQARELLDAVLAETDDAARCRRLDGFLLEALPAPDPRFSTVRAVVDAVLADRTLTRVDDVAAAHGLTVRTLQRLMRDHVGVSATWLVRRFRLHDAVADLQVDPGIDLAELAVRLGWYDQAHLTRDFTRAVGVSPARYARALRAAVSHPDP
jgi:AraC-like DNA-binding protein